MLLLVSIRIASRSGRFGFGRELENVLRLLVLADLEIVPAQIRHKPALLVRDREQQVHAIHFQRDPVSVGFYHRRGFRILRGQCQGNHARTQQLGTARFSSTSSPLL